MTKKTYQFDIDTFRANFNKYTRKAFEALPKTEAPHILDIGCGSGVPTMELAALCDGRITGLDNDSSALEKLNGKVRQEGLIDRVTTVKGSLFDLNFPEAAFDIIWAEGVIALIGFEKGLQEWRRFLKPGGFCVVHDDAADFEKKCQTVPNCGYELHHHFLLPADAWWADYYGPLERHLRRLSRSEGREPQGVTAVRQEIAQFKKDPDRYRSGFIVARRV